MGAIAVLVSRAEFDARTAAGERLEYDDGQVIEMANNDSLHEGIKSDLSRELSAQLPRTYDLGAEITFEVTPDCIRQPDISVCLTRPARTLGKKRQGAKAQALAQRMTSARKRTWLRVAECSTRMLCWMLSPR